MRLILFADPDAWSSMALLAAALRACAQRSDVDAAAIVETPRTPPPPRRRARLLAVAAVRRAFAPRRPARGVDDQPLAVSPGLLARRHRVEPWPLGQTASTTPGSWLGSGACGPTRRWRSWSRRSSERSS